MTPELKPDRQAKTGLMASLPYNVHYHRTGYPPVGESVFVEPEVTLEHMRDWVGIAVAATVALGAAGMFALGLAAVAWVLR